jgi:hypothetical protein
MPCLFRRLQNSFGLRVVDAVVVALLLEVGIVRLAIRPQSVLRFDIGDRGLSGNQATVVYLVAYQRGISEQDGVAKYAHG